VAVPGVVAVPEPIRVLIADDHLLLRDGIAVLIANCDDIVVVGQAETGKEAIVAHRQLRPDVTLMDLQFPDMDGVDVIGAIRGEAPQARIIVLTTYSGDTRAKKALKAGDPARCHPALGLASLSAYLPRKRLRATKVPRPVVRRMSRNSRSSRVVSKLPRPSASPVDCCIPLSPAVSGFAVRRA
jgi:DNA-binding NarL/FixJ family response regulator